MRGECPVGKKYGRFTVISKDNSGSGRDKWICTCDCGVTKSVFLQNLKRGVTRSCGCLQKEEQSKRQLVDRTGEVYGRLKVISRDGVIGQQAAWKCQCDCGNVVTVASYQLGSGNTKSCGCLQKERAAVTKTTHGLSDSKEYRTWQAMRTRCTNENRDNYSHYGGRGIEVCSRWMNSFEAFYADMGPAPSTNHSIERNDVDGPYDPSNCRWATQKEQMRNTSRSSSVYWNGRSMTISELAELTSVDYDLLQARLARGWSVEDAVLRPRYARSR